MSQKKTILIVEDDVNVREMTRDFLESAGYRVFYTDNGKNGVMLAREILPDLIICDINMPGMSGYDVLGELRQSEDTGIIPFVFLSSLSDVSNIRQGMRLGADDYLTKPFTMDELLTTVGMRLQKFMLLSGTSKNKKEDILSPAVVGVTQENGDRKSGFIFVEDRNNPVFLEINTICCIEANAEYSNVFTENGRRLIVRKLLKQWEAMLPPSFIRIHRSTIINLKYVKRVEKWFNNSLRVYLEGIEEPVTISRRYASDLRQKLGGIH